MVEFVWTTSLSHRQFVQMRKVLLARPHHPSPPLLSASSAFPWWRLDFIHHKPVSCFSIELLICDGCFISVFTSPVCFRNLLSWSFRSGGRSEQPAAVLRASARRWNTRIWSEFKSDLLFLSSESVNLFFFSCVGVGWGGGGCRKLCKQTFPQTEGKHQQIYTRMKLLDQKDFSSSSSEQLWLSKVSGLLGSLSFHSFRDWHKLNLPFLRHCFLHLSRSCWLWRRCGGCGAAAPELMGLCRWQRS